MWTIRIQSFTPVCFLELFSALWTSLWFLPREDKSFFDLYELQVESITAKDAEIFELSMMYIIAVCYLKRWPWPLTFLRWLHIIKTGANWFAVVLFVNPLSPREWELSTELNPRFSCFKIFPHPWGLVHDSVLLVYLGYSLHPVGETRGLWTHLHHKVRSFLETHKASQQQEEMIAELGAFIFLPGGRIVLQHNQRHAGVAAVSRVRAEELTWELETNSVFTGWATTALFWLNMVGTVGLRLQPWHSVEHMQSP